MFHTLIQAIDEEWKRIEVGGKREEGEDRRHGMVVCPFEVIIVAGYKIKGNVDSNATWDGL